MTTPGPSPRPARQVGERLVIVTVEGGERLTATVIAVDRLTVTMEAPDGRQFLLKRFEVN